MLTQRSPGLRGLNAPLSDGIRAVYEQREPTRHLHRDGEDLFRREVSREDVPCDSRNGREAANRACVAVGRTRVGNKNPFNQQEWVFNTVSFARLLPLLW